MLLGHLHHICLPLQAAEQGMDETQPHVRSECNLVANFVIDELDIPESDIAHISLDWRQRAEIAVAVEEERCLQEALTPVTLHPTT
jgi:hypothetical protein